MKKSTNTHTKIDFKEIYTSQYLIYNRKSTDEPENQKNSIQYQKSENERFALRENMRIANITIEGFCTNGIISERHSAFKEDSDITIGANGMVQYKIDRPKFHRMLDLLNRGYFKGVIILCWDRISRNKADETIIRKLMKQGVDFKFVLASYDNTSSGALHMDIDGMFAAHHSRVTSEKVKLNIRNQKEKGICTYLAPIGYLNIGTMEHKPLDPIRSPIIKRLFELYATGEYSLASLVRYATSQGLTMPPRRARRTSKEVLSDEDQDSVLTREKVEVLLQVSTISRILSNPFYKGFIKDNYGGYMRSISHEPLVSEELFEKVQLKLTKKNTSIHYSDVITYPYRGLFRCHGCKRVFTPYIKKGTQYYYTRCKDDCNVSIKNFSLKNIDALIDGCIEKLCFSKQEFETLESITRTDIAVFNAKRTNKLEDNDREKTKLREYLMYLQNNRIELLQTGLYTPQSLLEEQQKLQAQLKELQEIEVVSDIAMFETIKEANKLSELLKTLIIQDFIANPKEKEELVRNIFSELSIYNNTLLFKCNSLFEMFSNRLIASGAPLDWIYEFSKYLIELKKLNNEIQQITKSNFYIETKG